MTAENDVNNARYLKYRSKFFISEFTGTALLLFAGLSGVIFMFGSGSPMANLIVIWMGVVNLSYLMYDDPDCYADMVDTRADCEARKNSSFSCTAAE